MSIGAPFISDDVSNVRIEKRNKEAVMYPTAKSLNPNVLQEPKVPYNVVGEILNEDEKKLLAVLFAIGIILAVVVSQEDEQESTQAQQTTVTAPIADSASNPEPAQ